MKTILLSIVVAMTLTGCFGKGEEVSRDPVIQTELVSPTIPSSLRVCASIPATPEVGATQKTVAVYLLDLSFALEDCKSKHRSLIYIIDDFKAKVEKRNEMR